MSKRLIYEEDAIDAVAEGLKRTFVEYRDVAEKMLNKVPSAQPEHLVKESGNLVKGLVNDCISRQAAIDAVKQHMNNVSGGNDEYYIAHRHIIELLRIVPSVQPQRMSDDETCDSCRYRYNEWDEDPCDGCTPADSGYSPDSIELQPPISKREWYQKGYEAGQKSVQPQRWVSVSEALPKDDEEVIVTCLDDSGDTPFSYTTVAWHYKGMWVCENERCPFVVGWMPLPEPYRGEQK